MEWDHPSTSHPYYWHPDWLQNAEDLMGLYPDNSHPTSANPDE
ncbi:hypothetical protein VIC_001457 [Vibrio coralliilyticus ATCC BAA-450]|nr:hypothetical protein VIC_001457 [Vibrio coralliilyticus ATCC BAA-450]